MAKLPTAERIVVIGTSCTGKSTFARLLADGTGLPIVELDSLYWASDWKPADPDTFRQRVLENTSGDGWIVVGNYGTIRDALWSRATTVFWLNYGFALTFSRALRRTTRRAFTREELWNGNRESIRRSFFSRDSILWWVITTHRRRREEFTRLRDSAEYRHLRWVEFQRPREAEVYVRCTAR
jgi:adenylate kinase family enzyme